MQPGMDLHLGVPKTELLPYPPVTPQSKEGLWLGSCEQHSEALRLRQGSPNQESVRQSATPRQVPQLHPQGEDSQSCTGER